MFLLGKNANLLSISAPAAPADPGKGIPATGPTVRWSGSADAYVDEDIMDQVRNAGATMRVQVSKTIVDLPVNLPVWPNPEDILTFKRIDAIARGQVPAQGGSEETPNETLIVRTIDGGLMFLGKLRCLCVRS